MHQTRKQLVFIVDDDESVRRSMKRLLRSAGFEAETFASAEEFLDRARTSSAGQNDVAWIHCVEAALALTKGKYQEAQQLCEGAHEMFNRLGDKSGLQECGDLEGSRGPAHPTPRA